MNQDTVANQAGVSLATLSSYEKKDKLGKDILDKIAKTLGISQYQYIDRAVEFI